MNRWIIH